MPIPVFLPKFSSEHEESLIVSWLVQPGKSVRSGDPVCEVETDKVNMEVEAPESGRLAGLRYQAGETVQVTQIIAYILLDGESEADLPLLNTAQAAPNTAVTPVARRMAQSELVDLAQIQGSGARGRITRRDIEATLAPAGKIRAAPAARAAAREKGVDLAQVVGTGLRGRVQSWDVAAQQPAAAGGTLSQQIKLTGMRRTIAMRMQQSWQTAPHIFFEIGVDTARMDGLRQQMKARGERLTMTALLAKACAWALQKHPQLNATYEDDTLFLHPSVNMGIAVALDAGLIVPVVRAAEKLPLREIQAQIDSLTQKAKAGSLGLGDISEGTFTISNLGMHGVERFTAILNPPQVAILAVGRAAPYFLPDENGQPVLHTLMALTLSVDHRVIDGANAALFLGDLKAVLEEPALLAY